MELSRRTIVRYGLNAVLSIGGLSLLGSLGRKSGFYTVAFTTHYPSGKNIEDFNLDQKKFFRSQDVLSVEKNQRLKQLVLFKKTIKKTSYHMKVLTFSSKENYLRWENELANLDIFDSKAMKNLGYRMNTTKFI